MKGWEKITIGEIARLATGGTPSRSKPEYFGGDIKWLVSGDIHQGEIFDCDGRITSAALRNSNARLLPAHTVMIALNGQGKTRGSVALLRVEAACNQSLVCIIPDTNIVTPEFLFWNLKGRYAEIRRLTSEDDNDRRGLNMPIIRSIPVEFPPLDEQRRIVAVLDEVFAGLATMRAHAEANLANARALFDSHLNAIFSQKGEGWTVVALGKHVDITHGFAFDGCEFEASSDCSKPIVLTPGNYTENGNLYFNNKNTKRLSSPPPQKYLFRPGDLTVVMTDLSSKMKILGKPAFVEGSDILHNQRIGRVVFKDDILHPKYVYYFLRTNSVSEHIKHTSTGTMVRHTAPKRILANEIPVPNNLTRQVSVIEALDKIDEEVRALESLYRQKLAALDELKQTLLQKAFAGELTSGDIAA